MPLSSVLRLTIMLAIAMLLPAVAPADEPVGEATRDGYVLHAWDGVTMWSTILNVDYYGKPNRVVPEPAAPFSRRILEELIDEEAAAHVDAISYCLFTAFESDVPSSKVTDLFRWRPPGMDAAGIDPLKVLIDRCHFHGMQFISDIRMNDRHGGAAHGIAKQHPEWTILGTAYNYALDDAHGHEHEDRRLREAGQRNCVQDLPSDSQPDRDGRAERALSADGPGEPAGRGPELLPFRRRRRFTVQLSIRVRAARGGPSIVGLCRHHVAGCVGLAALGWLRELRYPDQIAVHDRHYLFYAVWKKSRHNITGTPNDDNIYLDRAQPTPAGSRRFRMAEKFDDPALRTTIQFKAIGLTEQDKLEIQINGQAVPLEYITSVFDANGQSVFEGDPLPAFHEYVIDLNWNTTGQSQPLVFGDNQLAVRLIPDKASGNGTVSIEELECYVYLRKPKRPR